ncbi:MAG: hypothetical protein ACE5Q6_13555 [Dehalococcoidia bacterium]
MNRVLPLLVELGRPREPNNWPAVEAKELGIGYATLKRLLDGGYAQESTPEVAD